MSSLDYYRLPQISQRWLSNSPFEQSAVEMGKHLTELGYTGLTITSYLSCIGHLAYWADTEGLQVRQITEPVVERFIQDHLPICHCADRCQRSVTMVRAAVLFWQRVACSCGFVKQISEDLEPLVCNELALYRRYLIEIRGLQSSTCDTRVQYVSDFLISQFTDQPVSIDRLKPTNVTDYVMHRTKHWKPGSIKVVCAALSSYLRFKALDGTPTAMLIAALPKVAQWRQASLPKALSSDEINTLLNAFNQSTRGGQRDYAIARCYIDLGLRTTEIVKLKVEDINWRQAVVYIRGKGRRVDALPLPKATGEAIARYLEHRDNTQATTALFQRLYPPLDRAATAETIRGSIRSAARRCGLSAQLTGPHRLRHTLATRLINSGVSLKEISDLMRHRDLDTTTIYAKVDMGGLSSVTCAWPEKFS